MNRTMIQTIVFGIILSIGITLSHGEEEGVVQLPNQWSLRPAGTSIPMGDLPSSMAISPDKKYVAVLHCGYGQHEIRIIDSSKHEQVSQTKVKNAWFGISFTPDGKQLYASTGSDDGVTRYDFQDGNLTNPMTVTIAHDTSIHKTVYPSGIAIDKKGENVYFGVQYGNALYRMSTDTADMQPNLIVEFSDPYAYPYQVRLHPSGKVAYVSLWGGKGVAEVNLQDTTVQIIPTDSHPNEMVLTRDGSLLYVACANANGVSIIDTKTKKVVEKLNTAMYPNMPAGSTPNGLTLSADEKTLLVANADNNDIVVFDVSKKGDAKSLGFIPVGWYPTSVAYGNNNEIMVTNGKGNGSKPNPEGPAYGVTRKTNQYIGGLILGSMSFIPIPNTATLKKYSQDVYQSSPLRSDLLPVKQVKDNPIPSKVGDPSPIKYVVYVIKENRTYDQVLGDIPEGNGDSTYCIFGEKVTPNMHKIVKDYVLLDNLYCDAEVSADGHEWSTGAYATDFVEKSWPVGYGRHGGKTGYKSEGTDPTNDSDAGHLWNRAKEKGITYRSYGEWVEGAGPAGKGHTTDPALVGHINQYYPGFNLDISDFVRLEEFQKEFAVFEKTGELPQLIIVRLPNDHTNGTSKGKKTPWAYVAENDLAFGQMLETLSRSTFWNQMAVFAIEDDAQNGSDHVDAHRSTGYVISPYVKQHYVDHHMYSTSGMLRTIELILGLEPMSQYDAAALPMYDSFTNQPHFEPYIYVDAQVPLDELNGPRAPMQKESSRLNFQREDANPDILFNEIIWKAVKGANSEMPAPVHAAFVKTVQKKDKDED